MTGLNRSSAMSGQGGEPARVNERHVHLRRRVVWWIRSPSNLAMVLGASLEAEGCVSWLGKAIPLGSKH